MSTSLTYMKNYSKILLFAVTISLILGSCSVEMPIESETKTEWFSPPSWIQGVWVYDGDFSFHGHEFTQNNWYILQGSRNSKLNQNGILTQQQEVTQNVKVDETSSTSEYRIVITTQSNVNEYIFKKISDNEYIYDDITFTRD